MAQRHILLTGATGFVGQLVLARLLQRADVGSVTCLVRKRAGSIHKRLGRVLRGPAFQELDDARRSDARAIEGELTAPELGLAGEVRAALVGRITDVVSVAASVRFDLPGPEAVPVNVDGPLRLLDLAEAVGAARMVHVSTAYVHPPGPGPHHPVLVPLPEPAERLVERVRRDAQPVMEQLGYPNSYTLTKCLAEHRLTEEVRSVALRLVRPSIVAGSWRWPEPGWVASSAALPAVQAAIGAGIYKLGIGDPEVRVDVVPVDVVARRVLEALDSDTPIVQAVAGTANSVRTVDAVRLAHEAQSVRNLTGMPDGVTVRPPGLTGDALHTAFNLAPLILTERLARLREDSGARRRAMGAREVMAGIQGQFQAFTTNEWAFTGGDLPADFDRMAYHRVSAAGVSRWMLRRDAREVPILGGRQPESDLGWVARKGPAGPLHRGFGLALRRTARRCVDRATVDLDSLREALARVPDGHHVVICPNYRSYADFLLVSYALQTLPGLGLPLPDLAAASPLRRVPVLGSLFARMGAFCLERGQGAADAAPIDLIRERLGQGRVLQVFIEGRRSRSGAFLPPRRGLLQRLQSTRERFALVPVSLAYDEVPELQHLLAELHGGGEAPTDLAGLRRWLGRVERGEVALGRLHLSASAPIRFGPDEDVAEVSHRLIAGQQAGVATTERHLASFAARSGLAATDLRETLRARGAHVLGTRLPPTADPRAERWMRSHWLHHLAPELSRLVQGHPVLEDHLGRTLWSKVPESAHDPTATAAAEAHLLDVLEDWTRTVETVAKQPWTDRVDVIRRAAGAWPVEVHAALDRLVADDVLIERGERLSPGPAFAGLGRTLEAPEAARRRAPV